MTRRQLARAVAEGRLSRLAPGRYACTHLDEPVRSAAGAGLLVDCVTALAVNRVWSGVAPAGLHLRATPGRHHGPVPRNAVVHWRERQSAARRGEVSALDAVLCAVRCLPPADALASIESALHLGYLTDAGLRHLVALSPRWMAAMLSRLDRGAQSGLETHARLKLVEAGHEVLTQVRIPGAGILDMLIDDCVGLETDGAQWHETRFLADRTKDIGIEQWGIRVLRVGARHVFDEWQDTLAALERMIADSPRGSGLSGRRAPMHR